MQDKRKDKKAKKDEESSNLDDSVLVEFLVSEQTNMNTAFGE